MNIYVANDFGVSLNDHIFMNFMTRSLIKAVGHLSEENLVFLIFNNTRFYYKFFIVYASGIEVFYNAIIK
jgi:hypothetical protein